MAKFLAPVALDRRIWLNVVTRCLRLELAEHVIYLGFCLVSAVLIGYTGDLCIAVWLILVIFIEVFANVHIASNCARWRYQIRVTSDAHWCDVVAALSCQPILMRCASRSRLDCVRWLLPWASFFRLTDLWYDLASIFTEECRVVWLNNWKLLFYNWNRWHWLFLSRFLVIALKVAQLLTLFMVLVVLGVFGRLRDSSRDHRVLDDRILLRRLTLFLKHLLYAV